MLQDRVLEKLDFPDAGTLFPVLNISPDRRLILGMNHLVARPGDVITAATPARVVVLRIER